MSGEWLPAAVLRAASLLALRGQRAEWLREWRSELWYVPRGRAILFCLGAFRDALWLRRNSLGAVKRVLLDSPIVCLVLLSTLAGLSIGLAARLQTMLQPSPVRTSAIEGIADMAFFYLLLAAIALMIGDSPGKRRLLPRPATPRSCLFLGLKIVLAMSVLKCVLLLIVVIDVPVLTVAFFTGYVLLFRWVFTDQQRRCPVCLRLLSKPVRIGSPSQTFLEWYGAELVCIRGHGVMQVPELSATYSGSQRWLRLDDSWSGLFPAARPRGNHHA